MRILGVDPGSRVTGWAVLASGAGGRAELAAAGNIRLKTAEALPRRLVALRDALEAVVREHDPGLAAIESVFSGVNPQALIRLSHARGIVLEVLARAEIEIREFTPQQVKSAVVGWGRAEKSQIQRMVGHLVAGAERLPKDAADALAVAVAAHSGRGLERAIRSAETAAR